jgi:hypothetical protein
MVFQPVQEDSRLPTVNHPADPSEITPQVEETHPGNNIPSLPLKNAEKSIVIIFIL